MDMRPTLATLLGLLTSASCTEERVCSELEQARGAGELIWERRYDGGRVGSARDVAVDPCTGDVAVVGAQESATPDQSGNPIPDVWAASVDVEGRPRWSKRHAHGKDSVGRAVAIGPDGEIVAAGWVDVDDDQREVWLHRYDGAGELEWTRSHVASSTQVMHVAIDEAGTIYWAASGGLDPGAGLYAIDPEGETRWSRDFDENVEAILVVEDELLVVHGLFVNYDEDGFNRVSRFSRSGDQLESRELPEARIEGVTLTPGGGWAWIAWSDRIESFDRAGELRWTYDFDSSSSERYPKALVADDASVVVVGDIHPFGARRPWIAELSHEGELVAEQVIERDREVSVAAVALGPAGDIVMVGDIEAPPDLVADQHWASDAWLAAVGRLR